MRKPILLAALMLTASMPSMAMDHSHHMAPVMCKEFAHKPSVKAYFAAMKKMHADMDITYTGNADIDFVRGMVPHHQGAVDMVKVLHSYGMDPELRELGVRIVAAQKLEIAMMKRWLETHDNPKLAAADEKNPSVAAYLGAMESMHEAMNISYVGNADRDFVRGMIPHHQGAIDMAWVLKKYGTDPILSRLADDVIRSQSQEIAFMKEWLEKKGN